MLVLVGLRGLRRGLARDAVQTRAPRAGQSLLIGIVHGLAGSGSLTALVVANLSSTSARLAYIGLFGAGLIASMALLSGIAVGGLVVMKWGVGLCRAAGRQLLDATTSDQLERRIQSLLEEIDDVRVTDLHVWEVGPGRHACIATVITSLARDTEHYRASILATCPIAHLTIEAHRCREGHSSVEAGTGALVPS